MSEIKCVSCINRILCPVMGRSCDGYNDLDLFRGYLMMLAPKTDWNTILGNIKKLQQEG